MVASMAPPWAAMAACCACQWMATRCGSSGMYFTGTTMPGVSGAFMRVVGNE